MRKQIGVVILSVVVGLGCWSSVAAQSQNAATGPVVVELFTSEGCSSCPPADAALLELSRHPEVDGAQLILLGEHVDYWNYIGWTDRFSSAEFSKRQSEYAKGFGLGSVYTPQMVIDGSTQFVGNDAADVREKIAAAVKDPKPAQVAMRWEAGNRLHITVLSPAKEKDRVLLAITEDGLSTSVGKGENGGKTLHHAAVVRQVRQLGDTDKGKFEASADVTAGAGWNATQLKVAVLVQDDKTGKIEGAAQIGYAH